MSAKVIFKFNKNPLQIFQWSALDVIIDEQYPVKVPWSQPSEYAFEPGNHRVQMSFPYLGTNAGKAQADFVINEGETLIITYKPPMIVFSAGTIVIQRG